MKKIIVLFLVFMLCLSLLGCGKSDVAKAMDQAIAELGPISLESEDAIIAAEKMYDALTEEQKGELENYALLVSARTSLDELINASLLTKDELMEISKPITSETLYKMDDNVAFANSLIGNVYIFDGVVSSVEEDYAVIDFFVVSEQEDDIPLLYDSSSRQTEAHIYLPNEELISIENNLQYTFVGKFSALDNYTYESIYTSEILAFIFENAAIVSDRYEKTGILHSKNPSYGENAWNIKFPNSDYLGLVIFTDDVSAYQGKEITYSYKVTHESMIIKSIEATIVAVKE